MNTKISGAIISGLALIGVGGYLESSNDITINETVEFDSQEEFEQIKDEMTDLYLSGSITKINDAKDLGAMIKYSKGENFLEIKNSLIGKENIGLIDRQLLIAVIQAQKEIRQEELILVTDSEKSIKDEINTYLEDL